MIKHIFSLSVHFLRDRERSCKKNYVIVLWNLDFLINHDIRRILRSKLECMSLQLHLKKNTYGCGKILRVWSTAGEIGCPRDDLESLIVIEQNKKYCRGKRAPSPSLDVIKTRDLGRLILTLPMQPFLFVWNTFVAFLPAHLRRWRRVITKRGCRHVRCVFAQGWGSEHNTKRWRRS
jgi:hypothetical protein